MTPRPPSIPAPPAIRERGGMELVGMCRSMTMAGHVLPELWRAFRTRLAEVERAHRRSAGFVSMRLYGPLHGRPPGMDTPFEAWAAVEVVEDAPVPERMARHRVASGTWAVFEYRGAARDFGPAARWIHETWLPANGWAVDDREHFELLPADYVPTDPDAREEVWVPVRPAGDDG